MGIKKEIKVPEKVPENLNPYIAALQQISSSDMKNPSNAPISPDDMKDIETIKWILSAILDKELSSLESLTNLEPEELDDLNDAFYLNELFDNPRIDIFITHRLLLSRSKTKNDNVNNLLNILAEISGKSLKQLSQFDDKGIFGNRFK